jgi:hypothetical protein
MSKRKFWPLDFDLEGEIYENPTWDLPGLRRTRGPRTVRRARKIERPAAHA